MTFRSGMRCSLFVVVVCSLSTSCGRQALDGDDAGAVDAGRTDAGHVDAGQVDSGVDLCVGVTCAAVDQCHVTGVCDAETGECSNPAAANGTSCDDNDLCTQQDSCQSGSCVGANPVTCTAADQCHTAGTCDSATGQCSNPAAADGAACSDGDACTQTDTCQSGSCVGANSVTCTAADQCHVAGTCDSATGQCSNPNAADGVACDDSDLCTQQDSCQTGACVGANPVTCTALDQCHVVGVCDAATGQCSNPASADGSFCSDNDFCTQADSCQSGSCIGASPVTCSALDQCHVVGTCDGATGQCSNPDAVDGVSCSDGDLCTQQDTCQTGACIGANPVTCSALDQCHTVGTCNSATGQCSNPAAADGASCDDNDLCTQQDSCQTGACVGADPVVCTALDQCHVVGTCDSATGHCADPAAVDGTSCEEGDLCTPTDTCQSGVCQPSAPITCVAADSCHEAGSCVSATGQCVSSYGTEPISLSFESRWRNDAGDVITKITTATACGQLDIDVDDDLTPDFNALLTFDGGSPTLELVALSSPSVPAAIEAIIGDVQHLHLERAGLRLGFDAVDGGSPEYFSATLNDAQPLTVTVTSSTAGTAVVKLFDGTDAAPIAPVSLRASGLPLQTPTSLTVNASTSELSWNASDAIGGFEFVNEALQANAAGVPMAFTTTLGQTIDAGALVTVTVPGALDGGAALGSLRLAAGTGVLPGPGSTDALIWLDSASSQQVSLRLSALKGLSLTPQPFNVTLDTDETNAQPLSLNVSLPTDAGTPLTISGTLNKPAFHSEVSALPSSGSSTSLRFNVVNGSAALPRSMASLNLSFTNLGGSPATSLSLSNLPRVFSGCIANDASCVVAPLPTRPATFNPSDNCTAKPIVPGNFSNRPYNPQASFNFDDQGSSGVGRNIATMVTINASITPATGSPLTLTNVRVHALRGDVADGATTFTFKPIVSISAGEVPRMYAFVDSLRRPFVINSLSDGALVKLTLGTDATPAAANMRLSWVPGAVRSSILGCGVGQNISTQSSGALDCGGAKEMQLSTSLGTLNMFNLPLFGDVLGICGGTVGTPIP